VNDKGNFSNFNHWLWLKFCFLSHSGTETTSEENNFHTITVPLEGLGPDSLRLGFTLE
jgi:hypothetical protein